MTRAMRLRRSRWAGVAMLVVMGAAPHAAQVRPGDAVTYDLILRHGTIVDGTGLPRYAGDIAIAGHRIARIGDLSAAHATVELDVRGLMVAPGFINLHSHADAVALPTAANMLMQGVTTEILNPDGSSPPDIGGQLDALQKAGLAVNVGAAVGFNSVWAAVMGATDHRPSADDIARMRAALLANLGRGAWAASARLDYKPGYFAHTDEVTAVVSAAAPWRTNFPNHERLTPESGFSSRAGIAETIGIGESSGVAPVVTHMKVQGHENGSATDVLAMMRAATARGHYTAADAYPYLAGQTSLASLIIPGWAQEGGTSAMRDRFGDPALRSRIVREAEAAMQARFTGGPAGILLPATNRSLADAMREMKIDSPGEAVVRLLEHDMPTAILSFGAEADLVKILQYDATAVACDCGAVLVSRGHPRYYGTFPRVLGHYVRETHALTWEDAVRKMTGLPASIIGMVDRGLIAPGMAADVTVFDTAAVIDRATYEHPTEMPDGVRHVVVNGRLAVLNGKLTGERNGLALLRSGHMPTRAMSMRTSRHVAAHGALVTTEGEATLELDIAQRADTRSATGTLSVQKRNGTKAAPPTLAVSFGVLQVARDWASVTGWARDANSTDLRPFTLIVDRTDPLLPSHEATIVLDIDGTVLVGHMPSTAVVLAGVPGDLPAASTPVRKARIVAAADSLAKAGLVSGPDAGIAIAVSRGAETILEAGYGTADLENGVPVTRETVFRIGSLTKQFTAAAILRLAQDGKLALDDDLTKYLPDFPTHGARITLRHLLNHTSGLRNFTTRYGVRRRLDLTDDQLLETFRNEPLDFAPGTRYSYSNSGYYLLGMIIEKVSGKRYDEFLQSTFFAPLGMKQSYYCHNDPIIPHRARGYGVKDGRLVNSEIISLNPPGAAGALCSTVHDLVTWTRALHGGKVLSAEFYRTMITPGALTDGTPIDYAGGLRVGTVEGHPVISHGGSISGFRGFLAYYPKDNLVVAVLYNSERAPLGDNVARAALGLRPIPITAAQLVY